MYKIDFEYNNEDDALLPPLMETIITHSSKLVGEVMKEDVEPFSTVYNKLYEAEGEGAVLYRQFMNLSGATNGKVEILLLGFDERKCERFVELKKSLEGIMKEKGAVTEENLDSIREKYGLPRTFLESLMYSR
ncbi:MAG: hypothetical protein Q8P15_02120 [Nanoarchaeota archaeon]|nr:hypothetical protein [Nanoarchaeota archaeon]